MRALLILAAIFVLHVAPARAQEITRVIISSGARTNGVVRIEAGRRIRELRACLHASPTYAFVLRLSIDAEGHVTGATARGTGLSEHGVACIEGTVPSWTFRASTAPTRARIEIASSRDVAPPPERTAPPSTAIAPSPLPGSPAVRVPATTVDGALDVEAVSARVRERALRRVQTCYTRALGRNPAIAGSMALELTTRGNGAVTSARVVRALADAEIGTCVIEAFRALRFPSSSGNSRIELTLAFELDPS